MPDTDVPRVTHAVPYGSPVVMLKWMTSPTSIGSPPVSSVTDEMTARVSSSMPSLTTSDWLSPASRNWT